VLGNNATEDAEISGTIVKTGGNIVGGDVFQGSTDVGDTTVADVFAATVDIDPSAGTVFAGVLADNGGSVQTIALKSSGRNPALDASNANAPTTDARGEARFDQTTIANTNGSVADLGAYEVRTLVGVAITGNAKANVINATHTLAGQPLPGGGDDFISGRGGNDRISALDGDDTIIGGKGVDKMRGGDGADIFQFNSLAELKTIQVVTVGSVPTHKVLFDHIMDFAIGDDQLDFGNIDANKTASGKQDFTLIGSSKFSGDAGELRFVNKAGGAVVLGDVNGDGKADFKLVLDHATIAADDFILA
jgi:Ca2+-binding RTX toxin-like protein